MPGGDARYRNAPTDLCFRCLPPADADFTASNKNTHDLHFGFNDSDFGRAVAKLHSDEDTGDKNLNEKFPLVFVFRSMRRLVEK